MKIEIYVGVGKDKDGIDITKSDRAEMETAIRKELSDSFGGFTEYCHFTTGEWQGIREEVRKYDVLADDNLAECLIRESVARIRDIARQSCVAVNITKSDVLFV